MEWKCECGEIFTSRRKLQNHKKECETWKNKNKYGWSKGLTKYTDERLLHLSNTIQNKIKNNEFKKPIGKCIDDEKEIERRKKISESMKKAANEGRNVGWASTRKQMGGLSYPEKYFKTIIDNEFNNKSYEINYPVGKYKLDFAWPDIKVYIEIDGEQHYTEENIQKDEIRDSFLKDNGWKLLKRIRWSNFQKLNKEEREKFIKDIMI